MRVGCIKNQFYTDGHGILLSAMFGFAKNSPDATCGVILDITSARVNIEIVIADPAEPGPIVVWSHTERVLASELHTFANLAKKIITASTNAFLALGSQGMKTLHTYDPHATLAVCDVLVGAPWAHTVTQKVSYHKEEPFLITEALLEDVLQKAETDILVREKQQEILASLDLELLTKKTNGCQLNGYTVVDPIGKTVQELDLQQTVGVVHTPVNAGVQTSYETILQSTHLQKNTKIAALKDIVSAAHEKNAPYALLLVSGEVTEVGFMRAQTLQTSVYDEWGHNTIVRHVMEVSQRPYADVLSIFAQPIELVRQQLEAIKTEFYQEVYGLIKDHVLRTIGRLQTSDHSVSTLYYDIEPTVAPLFLEVFKTLAKNEDVGFKNALSVQSLLQQKQSADVQIDSVLAHVFHTTHAKK